MDSEGIDGRSSRLSPVRIRDVTGLISGLPYQSFLRLSKRDLRAYFRPAGPLGVALGAASALAAAACALSSTEIRPSDLRTSVSIFAAMSLFSFRNCLAFSRPWPMRSPL